MSSITKNPAWPTAPETSARAAAGLTLLEAYSILAHKAAKTSGVEAPPSGNLNAGDSAFYLWRCVVPRREAI